MQVKKLKDKYRIERKLAEGGMSSIYLCTSIELGNKWIIKHIDRKYSGLVYEEEILKRLYHVSLPQIVDIYRDATGLYIVETYIQGISLQRLLELRGSFRIEQTIDYSIQLCEVLMYLHNLKPVGIIHKDLKPSNVIVTEDNKLVLIDFGISEEQGCKKLKVKAATSAYAPPEQLLASQKCDRRGDIYSLGIVMFQMLTGSLPNGEYTPCKTEFPAIYKKLLEISQGCTAFLPESRYQEVEIIKKELQYLRDRLILEKEKLRLKRKLLYSAMIALSLVNYFCLIIGFLHK